MMKKAVLPVRLLLLLIGCCLLVNGAEEQRQFQARYLENADGSRTLISKGWVNRRTDRMGQRIEEARYPQFIAEGKAVPTAMVVELNGTSEESVEKELSERGVSGLSKFELTTNAADEVVTMVVNGPEQNRIDFVFLGDGYIQAERAKFLADIQRLVDEMFRQETFRSFLPLFNVHAVFRASRESGIGRDNIPKDTAYRLYREGNTLRAIYSGNPDAARESGRAAPDCDYLVIIANDPYYGGIGGEIAISTSSRLNGTVVLRHELGHTVNRVGDEYDGAGASYFGANFSQGVTDIPWSKWLTETGKTAAPEPATAVLLAYPWYNLGKGPYVGSFTSSGASVSRLIRFSVSGQGNPKDRLELFLNGVTLPVELTGQDDRVFVDLPLAGAFSPGENQVLISEGFSDGDNMLCHLTIHEYGSGFHSDPDYIGAFPVFYEPGKIAGFRPTNETCLMRKMNHASFCPVCHETLWLRILERVSLIDGIRVQPLAANKVHVSLTMVALGQLRARGNEFPGEKYQIRWLYRGKEVAALRDKLEWTGEVYWIVGRGSWEVKVTLVTPEVRSDPRELLTSTKKFNLGIK